jgi:GTP-sensing pleiotropic transcriptional regulator CodY
MEKHRTNNIKTQNKQYKNTEQTIQKHRTNNTKTKYKKYKNMAKTIRNIIKTSTYIIKKHIHTLQICYNNHSTRCTSYHKYKVTVMYRVCPVIYCKSCQPQ